MLRLWEEERESQLGSLGKEASEGLVYYSLVPDSDVIGVLPSETDLQVVVVHNQLLQPVAEEIALALCQAVDLLAVQGIERFPACDA